MKISEVAQNIESTSVYEVAVKTPLDQLLKMSKKVSNAVFLKREDLQPVHSFKLRGAYHKITCLSDAEKQKGIIAASAGNHAQGVAMACYKLGLKAVIVMPDTTPPIKVSAVKEWQADVILFGDTYDAAYAHAHTLCQKKGYTFVHPYDDYDVIAGQGTVAKEIFSQVASPPDYIFVPTGGGGLLAGVLAYAKTHFPQTKIISVEPDSAACLKAALDAQERVILKDVGIFADGVAVKQIGERPFALVRDLIDDAITVDTDEICAAIKDIYEDTRSIAEPAGALALAGLKKYIGERAIQHKALIAINSGANLNFDRLRHIAERADLGEQSEALFAVEIPEKPGSFKAFCRALGHRSITEFNYRYRDAHQAKIFVGVALKNGLKEKEAILSGLREQQYPVQDLTDNELAKLHVRHMVGGGLQSTGEVIYRFRFPEKPGALAKFLDLLSDVCNITLFHYRNHGAAFGRVLAGFQLVGTQQQFEYFLNQLDYPYYDETNNPAYQDFLR